MTHTDPISDLLTRLRNSALAKKEEFLCPSSSIKIEILKVLKEKGLVEDFEIQKEGNRSNLVIKINSKKEIRIIKRISKPGQRIYSSSKDIKKVLSGLGFSIISTSQGIITDKEARKRNIGGEILCEIA